MRQKVLYEEMLCVIAEESKRTAAATIENVITSLLAGDIANVTSMIYGEAKEGLDVPLLKSIEEVLIYIVLQSRLDLGVTRARCES